MANDTTGKLVYARTKPLLRPFINQLLKLYGIEIPASVQIGRNFKLMHGGFGVVIHPSTKIGNNVQIYQGVTLGRSDSYRPMERSEFGGFVVEDGVLIGAGAVVMCKKGVLTLGANSIVGANSLLLNSTGEDEIWGGNPARLLGKRLPEDRNPS